MATSIATLVLDIKARNETAKAMAEVRADMDKQVTAARATAEQAKTAVKTAADQQVLAVKAGLDKQVLAARQAADQQVAAIKAIPGQAKPAIDAQVLAVKQGYEQQVQAARAGADQQKLAIRAGMAQDLDALKAGLDQQLNALRAGEAEQLAEVRTAATEQALAMRERGEAGAGVRERVGGIREHVMGFLGFTAGAAAIGAGFEAVHELPKSFLEAASASQQFTTQMRQFYGSQDAANKVLEYGNQFAIKYGLSLDQVRDAIAKAASSGQDVPKLLPAGADIAAAFGSTLPDFMAMFNKAFATQSDRGLKSYLHMTRAQLMAAGVEYDKHGKIISSSLAPALERLATSRFGDAAANQAKTFAGALQSLKDVWETFKEVAGNALMAGLRGPLGQVTGWLRTHQEQVKAFAAAVGAAMGHAVQATVNFARAAGPPIMGALHAIRTAWPSVKAVWDSFRGTLGTIIHTVGQLVGGIKAALAPLHLFGVSSKTAHGALSGLGVALGILVPLVGTYIGVTKTIKAATDAWKIAQAALNLAMSLNPITAVIVVVAALVVGVIYAYNHFKTFHDWVNKVWAFLSGTFGPTLHALASFLQGAFSAAWSAVSKVAQAAWHDLQVIWTLIAQNLGPTVTTFADVLSGMFTKAWDTVCTTVKDAWTDLNDVWTLLTNSLGPIIKTVGDALSGAFTQAWDDVKTGVQDTWDVLKNLWDFLSKTFHLEKIGQGIKDALGGAFDFVKQKIDDFIGGFENVLKALEHLPGMAWIKATLASLSHAVGKAQKEVKEHETTRHAVQQHVHQHRHVHTVQGEHRGVPSGAHGRGHEGAGEGLPPLLHPAATGHGAARTAPSAADVVKARAQDFSIAMGYFRASHGLDPADVKRMQGDIAAIRARDPGRAAKLQQQLDVAVQRRHEAIAHHGAVEAHHHQVQQHHAQQQAQRAAHHNQVVAHHAQVVAQRAAHHAQVVAQRAAHHAQVVAHHKHMQEEKARKATVSDATDAFKTDLIDLGRGTKDHARLIADVNRIKRDEIAAHYSHARVLYDFTENMKKVTDHFKVTATSAARQPVAPVPRYGALAGETGYGQTTVSFGGAQANPWQSMVAALREQITHLRAQLAKDDQLIALLEVGNATGSQQLGVLRSIDGHVIPGPPSPARSAHSALKAAGSYAPVTR